MNLLSPILLSNIPLTFTESSDQPGQPAHPSRQQKSPLHWIGLLCIFSLFLLTHSSSSAQKRSDQIDVEKISVDSVIDRGMIAVGRLASPEFRGRGYSRSGHRIAADYIAQRFSEIGLEQIEADGKGDTGWFQFFTLTVDTFVVAPQIQIDGRQLQFGSDYVINPGNIPGKIQATDVETVDVQHGLSTSGYEQLKGKELRGKLAIIESTLPNEIEQDDKIDRSAKDLQSRIVATLLAGATGAIVKVDRPTYGKFHEEWPRLIIEADRTIIDSLVTPTSSIRMAITPPVRTTLQTQNVVGLLKGTGKSDSLILICGHYDHLGAIDDSIYFPGANDNASGIALMLELADYFRQHPLPNDILFVAFSGEEVGLKGSYHFAEHPPVDLASIRFMLNIDMAASGRDGFMALGGVEYQEEYGLLQTVHDLLGLPELRKREKAANSDQWFLYQKGVAGFYLYPFVGHQPYHHVHDEAESLQWETFGEMFQLVRLFLEDLTGTE